MLFRSGGSWEFSIWRSQGRADWDRQIENFQDPPAYVFVEKIRDERWSDRDERRFPDTDQRMANQQLGVGVCHCRKQRQAAPEKRSQHDDEFARVAVGQRTYERRRNHVETEEGAGQISNLLFGNVELILHQRLDSEQHVAVRIIEQIERRQND